MASSQDKGKTIVGDFPPEYWQFSEDDEPTPAIPPPENLSQQASSHPPTAASKQTTSLIWEHFNRVEKTDRGISQIEVVCKHCEATYKFSKGQGYGTFKRHLEKKHPTLVGIDNKQQQISRYATSNTQLFRYDENKYKISLGKFVCVENLSYSFGEKCQYNKLITSSLCPQANRIPRNTLKRTINKTYKEEKYKLVQTFTELNGSVHIGSDIWSDHWQKHSYMGVCCHWIDNNYNIQKRLLAYRVMDERHTANNIYKTLREILEEYNLVKKVFSIGFDNAAANTCSIRDLINICQPQFEGKFFHIRCVCHVLNLCVQDGLKNIDELISPIRIAISYLWKHPQTMREWTEFCKTNNRRPRRFPRDVPTRWNSTYELLKQAFEYSDLLCSFFITKNIQNITLYPLHWNMISKILDILQVFYNATLKLSGVYYPTTHLFMFECVNIVDKFQQYKDTPQLHQFILDMRSKWLNYYREIPIIYLVGTFFYPRNKLEGVEIFVTAYYESLEIDEINIRKIVMDVKSIVTEIYNEFSSKYNIGSTIQTSEITTSNTSTQSKAAQLMMQKNKKHKGMVGGTIEIENYLSLDFDIFEDEKNPFLILDWWKKYAKQFPTLALIAKQILATPCSTVAVEQTFSAGGNILDEHRSQLLPQNLEAQTCVADWTKAENRQQDLDDNDDGGDSGDED